LSDTIIAYLCRIFLLCPTTTYLGLANGGVGDNHGRNTGRLGDGFQMHQADTSHACALEKNGCKDQIDSMSETQGRTDTGW